MKEKLKIYLCNNNIAIYLYTHVLGGEATFNKLCTEYLPFT